MNRNVATLLFGALMAVYLPAQAWYGPYGPPWGGGYRGAGPAWGWTQSIGARVEKGATEDGYWVKVYLNGKRPGDIEAVVDHGRLLLYSTRSKIKEQQLEGGYSYTSSYQHFNHRVPLPADADASRMTRTDGDNVIELLIPRKQ